MCFVEAVAYDDNSIHIAIYGSFILPTFVLFGKGLPLILGSKSLLYVHPVEIPLTFADKDVYNS